MQVKDEKSISDYEKDVDMSVLYEEEPVPSFPEKVVNLAENVPISLRLVQTAQDDDPSQIEGMMMTDPNIPLNLRLVHIETEQGDELIRIQ